MDIEESKIESSESTSMGTLGQTVKPANPNGNYHRCLKSGESYWINIGPQWYILLIVTIALTAFGAAILYITDGTTHPVVKTAYGIVFTLMVVINLLMFISNPGIISNTRFCIDEENMQNFHCEQCLSLKSQEAEHCTICDVCIEGFDHHCVFLGKCIGAKNIVIFYCYIGVIPGFFWGSIIALAIGMQELQPVKGK